MSGLLRTFSSINYRGYKFLNGSKEKIASTIFSDTLESGISLHLVNSYTISEATQKLDLASILMSDPLICDGKPLALLLRRKEANFQNIRGVELMRYILGTSPASYGHFFLGGTDIKLKAILSQVYKLNLDLNICGTLSPPMIDNYFDYIESWSLAIRQSGAKIVWVGLGTPKQDYIGHELAKRCNVIVIPVGAAFDFIGGMRQEAPEIIQRLYLEWLHRLIQEPRRLLKRYFLGNLRFIRFVLFNK